MKAASQNIQQRIRNLADDYFSFLARNFPVMCASDEFHFMPRVEEACQFYDSLDSMEEAEIINCTRRLKVWENETERMLENHAWQSTVQKRNDETMLQAYSDLHLLKSSISALLIEFEYKKSWKHNPLLYLKIGFIGIDHALQKPSASKRETLERARKRLETMPTLLNRARENLDVVPEIYLRGALDMADDCRAYLEEIPKSSPENGELSSAAAKAAAALAIFRDHLSHVRPGAASPMNPKMLLEKTVRDHFQLGLTIPEIMGVARTQWDENLHVLEELGSRATTEGGWLALYDSMRPCELRNMDIIELYRQEYRRLQNHFNSLWSFWKEEEARLHICETPRYLRSIRASASFSAAFSRDSREDSFFYITTVLPDEEESKSLNSRLHREYLFLTAHETCPGHHYLDHIRRNIPNSVRRQIESPLFYEGWATFAESLLLETGYTKDTREKIVFHKRNLWRAARCLVDVGLTAGLMDMEEARRLLMTSGFSEDEATSQIRRFRLNPGYQLCYSLGLHEILKLKRNYGTLLGNDRFHLLLLKGGELPFSLIDLHMKILA